MMIKYFFFVMKDVIFQRVLYVLFIFVFGRFMGNNGVCDWYVFKRVKFRVINFLRKSVCKKEYICICFVLLNNIQNFLVQWVKEGNCMIIVQCEEWKNDLVEILVVFLLIIGVGYVSVINSMFFLISLSKISWILVQQQFIG